MHGPYIVYDYSIRIVIQSSIGPNDEPGKQAGRQADRRVGLGRMEQPQPYQGVYFAVLQSYSCVTNCIHEVQYSTVY